MGPRQTLHSDLNYHNKALGSTMLIAAIIITAGVNQQAQKQKLLVG